MIRDGRVARELLTLTGGEGREGFWEEVSCES